MNNVDISVVIPVKNGERYLEKTLKAIFSQKVDSEFEVIVVDSGSTDRSLEIISRYPATLYQIDERDFNHGLTRNFGISKSRGKYVILTTQDAVPFNNQWMRKLVKNLEGDVRVAGVYSRQIPHIEATVIAQMMAKRSFTFREERISSQIDRIEDYDKLSSREKYRFCNFDNVSSCIRKAAWEKFPFYKTDFGEDIEWAKRVLEAGYKIVYEPDSVVCHSHDFTIYGWYRRNRINYKRLNSLFGINSIDNLYKVLAYFPIYSVRDIYYLYKRKARFKDILCNIPFVPFYSFAEVFGQYMGVKDSNKLGTDKI